MRRKRFPYTKYAAGIAVIVYLTAYITGVDTFAWLLWLANQVAQAEMHTLAIPMVIVITGVCVDCWRNRRRQTIRIEQMRLLASLMINVDHLFRNLLNTLYFLRMQCRRQMTSRKKR